MYCLAARFRGKAAFAAVFGTVALAAPAQAASPHLGQRTLRQGMQGHDVRVLQQYLGLVGLATPVTGYFGSITASNVRSFDRRYGVRPVSGTVGGRFVRLIREIVANKQGTAAVADSVSGGASFAPAPVAPGPSPTSPTPTQPNPGATATLVGGYAVPPDSAPAAVKAVINAANQIAFKPYVYGGGHGTWYDTGYDCSGSVSFALHGGGLLSQTKDSTEFESYGSSGAGQWITLWANAGHVYAEIAGLWFDTAAQDSNGGSRWSPRRVSSASGYVERHPTAY
jgi:peptidoglycan hydrolase-like protein with peptidoglycan-binding domain